MQSSVVRICSYKSGRDTSLMSSVLAMISTELTMIMAIHLAFGSIV